MQPTKIMALGGVQEIGKATLLLEQDNQIILVDAGIKFADMFSTGVKGIIPDYSYLNQEGKIQLGIIITHGHEDHIGGVVYALKTTKIDTVIAPEIAIAYLKLKIKEHDIRRKITFIKLEKTTNLQIGPFTIDTWTAQHSIPDAFGVRIKTINGSVMCTGDFRFDYRPIGNLTDFTKLKQMGDEGLTVLLSDSTNAMRPFHSPSESDILFDIEKYMRQAKKKIIITAFASNLTRIKAIIDLAVKLKKKICVFGRSMVNGIEIGRKLKHIDSPDSIFVNKKNINKYDDNELIIITTGSQGEELAALARMSNNKHPYVQIKNGDLIIFSSSPIPGNRMKIEILVNKLYKLGAIIKENGVDGYLHTSGHAYREEHDKIFQLTRPKYFLPYHGEYRMSVVHGQSAIENGVKKENVMIPKLGVPFYMENEVVTESNEHINVGPIYIDGNSALESDSKVLAERDQLATNGFVNIILTIDKKNNNIVGKPRLISRGTFYAKNNIDIVEETKRIAHGAVLYTIKTKENLNVIDLKNLISNRLEAYFYKQKRRHPIIVPVILFINDDNNITQDLKINLDENSEQKQKNKPSISRATKNILNELKEEMNDDLEDVIDDDEILDEDDDR
ncbi:ribonuclease J [Mycoplasma elephantis]|uniref:ribonuclease J n=1 Tax=Mycoplasma elephantis TaxID=114882 RepID=UPI00047F1EFE|nr:ribonuclease J [Mycoplasma elephantis]